MKKISLKDLILNEVDQLSREQLKNVLGGYTGSSTGGGATTSDPTPCGDSDCSTDADCTKLNPICKSYHCIPNDTYIKNCVANA